MFWILIAVSVILFIIGFCGIIGSSPTDDGPSAKTKYTAEVIIALVGYTINLVLAIVGYMVLMGFTL